MVIGHVPYVFGILQQKEVGSGREMKRQKKIVTAEVDISQNSDARTSNLNT